MGLSSLFALGSSRPKQYANIGEAAHAALAAKMAGAAPVTAPGPVPLLGPAPPNAQLAASSAVGLAQLAAKKQRKRATAGNTGVVGATRGILGAPASLAKGLIGF